MIHPEPITRQAPYDTQLWKDNPKVWKIDSAKHEHVLFHVHRCNHAGVEHGLEDISDLPLGFPMVMDRMQRLPHDVISLSPT